MPESPQSAKPLTLNRSKQLEARARKFIPGVTQTIGKRKVVSCGYRGWHDQWAVAHTPRGIPARLRDLIYKFRYNDLTSLEEVPDANPNQVGAVIIDPVSGERPEAGFLAEVKELAHH